MLRAGWFALCFLLLVFATDSQAVTVFSVDQENPDLSSSYEGASSPQFVTIAQTFTPTRAVLERIRVKGTWSGPSSTVTLRLDVRFGSVAGPILGSSTITVDRGNISGVPAGTFPGFQFDFAPPLMLTPGSLHAFEVVHLSGSNPLIHDTDHPYPGGDAYVAGTLRTYSDLIFQTGSFFEREPKLYWVESSGLTVRRADLDGMNPTIIATALNPNNGISVDPLHGHVYWIECCGAVNSRIVRADFDGSNPILISTGSSFSFPQRILVDPVGKWIYWSDSTAGAIRRATLAGGGLQDLVGPDGTRRPVGLALDAANNMLYWTEFTGGLVGIHRLDLGTLVQTPILTATGGALIQSPEGLAIDPVEGKLYWTDTGRDEVRRANLDGSNVEVLANFSSHGLTNPIGIAVDPVGRWLYWSDSTLDEITRAELDGTNAVDILTSANGLTFSRALAVVSEEVPHHLPALPISGLGALIAVLLGTGAMRVRRAGRRFFPR